MIDFQADADEIRSSRDSSKLEEYCDNASQALDRVELLEEQLKQAKWEYRELTERIIPQLMEDMGFSGGTTDLKNGRKLILKDKVVASITEKNRDEAFSWLKANGLDGLIKNEIKVKMPRGDEERAEKLVQWMESKDLNVTAKKSVDSRTLAKTVEELLKQGRTDLPLEVFSVAILKQATIK